MPKDLKIFNEILHAIQTNRLQEVRYIFETKIKKKDKMFVPIGFGCVTEGDDKLIKEYENVILAAAKLEDTSILKYLLNNGININFLGESPASKTRAQLSPLHVAVSSGLHSTVALLVEANADVNKIDHLGRSPLHLAIKRADCESVRMLLCRGANVSLLDKSGTSCLQMAAKFGHVELVRILLEHNAPIFQRNQKGPSPLLVAAAEGHVPLIDLFSRYVDVNITSKCSEKKEKAALHVAAEKGHIETVQFLVERFGADVNVHDSDEQTPLHSLLQRRHDHRSMRRKEDFDSVAEFLMRKGVCIDHPNCNGDTALHFAVKSQFHRIAEMLLLTGMDALIKNKEGQTPRDLISDYDMQTKQLFNKYSALSSPYLKITCRQNSNECPPTSPHLVRPVLAQLSPAILEAQVQAQQGIKGISTGLFQAVLHNNPSEPSAPIVDN